MCSAPTRPPTKNEQLLARALESFRARRWAEAKGFCEKILAYDARHGEAWNRLGHIEEQRGDLDAAIAAYTRAAELLPDAYEPLNNLGVLEIRTGAIAAAREHLQRAATLRPDDAAVHGNLGCAYREDGLLGAAIDELSVALARKPDHGFAHLNIGVALYLQTRYDEALTHLRRAVELDPDSEFAQDNLLTCLNYSDEVEPEDIFAAHLRYGDRFAARRRPPVAPRPAGRSALRVGFVSPDLRQHSVAYFLEPLLAKLDRARFEVTCYSCNPRPDAVTERLRSLSEHWRDVSALSDDELAAAIRADGIDLLIDLAGHTANNRLPVFARRPAPVQLTWLGYPNTTGLAAMDFRLSDAWADPGEEAQRLCREQLLRLPGGFLCYAPPPFAPEVRPPPSARDGRVTFGCFNAVSKLSPATLRLFARVLAAVPASRLVLKHGATGDGPTRQVLLDKLAAAGADLTRVELRPGAKRVEDHLAQYGDLDIALDSYPYGGTTTTCEALWMGVPVVTLGGRTHASRVGASLLTRMGMADFIADDEESFVRLAAELAADIGRRASLRATQRARMVGALCDSERFARDFEQALLEAWRLARPDEAAAEVAAVPAAATTRVSMEGGLEVVVADTLEEITPYVLFEQGDWFEDEIHFVRRLMQPGERAIDIGANHGVYALTVARRVGSSGRVWAFEPGPATAARLRESVAINQLPWLEVIEAALSNRAGEAEFFVGASSELSSLNATQQNSGAHTRVEVRALDACVEQGRWSDVAFVKLDAEGEESRVLEGGARFFREQSPLVMFELKHGAEVNLELVGQFAAMGYASYRLVPALELLVPFDAAGEPDPFQLNLFVCKPDRARLLEERGLLVQAPALLTEHPDGIWQALIGQMPFAAKLSVAPGASPSASTARFFRALDLYAISRADEAPAAVRVGSLKAAMDLASSALEKPLSITRLVTLSRLASDFGLRRVAVEGVAFALQRLQAGQPVAFDEPFVPPSARFETVDPGDRMREWLSASALEQQEKLRAFSSFFMSRGEDTLRRLEELEALGFNGPEMRRRLELVRARRARL